MKTLADSANALAQGLAAIRTQYQVPGEFPAAVLAAAEAAAKRPLTDHVDRTDRPFVTLDPATSTDLDQAFTIEQAGADLLLHYAIADVAWFVDDGGLLDAEAWRRGQTLYMPDGKARLYPASLSEGAASLLPVSPRPAVIFTVRVAPDGAVTLDGAERAVIRSRAKLAYDSVRTSDLPPDFSEFARRMGLAEDRRGAARPARALALVRVQVALAQADRLGRRGSACAGGSRLRSFPRPARRRRYRRSPAPASSARAGSGGSRRPCRPKRGSWSAAWPSSD
jgi:hypothetical protein